MASIKLQFYKTNSETQRNSDITLFMRRLDKNKLQKWTVSEKIMAMAFVQDMEAKFNAFKKELLDGIK